MMCLLLYYNSYKSSIVSLRLQEDWNTHLIMKSWGIWLALKPLCMFVVVKYRMGVEEDWAGLIAQSQETLDLGMTPEDWKKV